MIGISAALALGACSSFEFDSFKPLDLSILQVRSVPSVRQAELRPITGEDLIDGEGRCAAAVTAQEVSPDGSPVAAVPLVPAGIALEMTECDVVRRAGHPERVQVGVNERNERTLTLTFIGSERPGIYHFTSGRLTSMERAPEPPAPPKPARRAKPAPKSKTPS